MTNVFSKLVDYTCVISIPMQMLGLRMVVLKVRKIKDKEVNKTYSQISIWILKQLFLGLVFMIFALLLTIFKEQISNWLGENYVYAKAPLNFIVHT